MMRSSWLCVLLLPSLVHGLDYLDDKCDGTVWVQDFSNSFFYIRNSADFYSTCSVTFWRFDSSGEIKLDISGLSLSSSDCKIEVLDSSYVSMGDVTGLSYFTKSFQSKDGTGKLHLHVTGHSCAGKSLSFHATEVSCPEFTCDDGECVPWSDECDGWDDCSDGSDEDGCYVFWTTGVYVGVSLGVVGLLTVGAVLAGVCYRRRVVMTSGATAGVIVSRQTLVTQTRW